MAKIEFTLNGEPVRAEFDPPTRTVLDWLRESRGLTGTKEGCNEGDCGACTITVSYLRGGELRREAVNSCILFLPQLHGKAVRTIEGVRGPGDEIHPVQTEMVRHHGSQCGFCTPGIVMSLVAAHSNGEQRHDDVLAGNLCRCTGYAPIFRAAEQAALVPPPQWMAEEEFPAGNGNARIPEDLDSFAAWYEANPGARLVAGATDVGLWVTKGMQDLPPVCFIGQLLELDFVRRADGWIEIGALVSINRLYRRMRGAHPGFAELLRRFGSVQVRNSATIGGNIANGSPIGDAAPALIALGAELVLRRGGERRQLALENFFIEYGKQDRRDGEFIECIRFPVQPDRLRCYKLSKRFDQDISAVCGCLAIDVSDGLVVRARLAFGGMAGIPMRAAGAEAVLTGSPWNKTSIGAAMQALRDDFVPISDARASAGYRLNVAQNMLLKYFQEDTRPDEPSSVLEI
ncbi:MAG: xanthine dehydrogenase small subunit [Rhodobacteraceae bacterium]|nr:xanthine dehydrogenase small subunit [Paracoccaceae bacterium]